MKYLCVGVAATLFGMSAVLAQAQKAETPSTEQAQPKVVLSSPNSDLKTEPPLSRPLAFHDPVTGNYFYVETDGRHISSINKEGKILWTRDPFREAGLTPYRVQRPVITIINRFKDNLSIGYNSSQFGTLDAVTGHFEFGGND